MRTYNTVAVFFIFAISHLIFDIHKMNIAPSVFMFYLIFSLHSDRTYASKYIPIIASVSEHQPPTWPSYFMDINVLAFLVPAGIIVSFEFPT